MTRDRSYAVSADEVNYLIFRYLQECGYTHAAFIFGIEGQIEKSKIDGSQIPPGILLSFIQRGVNFVEIENSLGECTDIFHSTTAKNESVSLLDLHRYMCDPEGNRDMWKNSETAEKMEIESRVNFEEEDMLTLKGHSKKILSICWNPHSSDLASVSGDSTTRIWKIPQAFPEKATKSTKAEVDCIVLNHMVGEPVVESTAPRKEEISSVAWSSCGKLLGTGTHTGGMRLWTKSGDLKSSCNLHKGPIFAMKWNPSGSYFLTGSVDKTVAIWNGRTGKCAKHYPFHDGAVMDVDWKNDEIFASCSSDKRVLMCSMNSNFPLLTFKGHEDEVNMVRFCPVGSIMGSVSDDKTVRLWCSKSSRLIHKLVEHRREVFALDWCPTAKRGIHLLSGSFDKTVKVWDANKGTCICTFTEHTGMIFSARYRNDGKLVASASSDGRLLIWNPEDHTVVKTFKGRGPIHELGWDHTGNNVAAGFEDGSVSIFDMRKMASVVP